MRNIERTWLKKFLRGAVFSAVIFALWQTPTFFVEAQTALERTGAAASFQEVELATVIGRIIAVFLGVLGVVFLGLVIYAGVLFMTAAGRDDRVEKAKKVLTSAVIGLIITMSAYSITAFVVQRITGQGLFGTSGGGGTSGGVSIEPFSGSLGRGIRDHYPARNATNVARNTKIFVTFSEQMNIESFIDGYDVSGSPLDLSDDTPASGLNDRLIKIYPTAQGESAALTATDVSVTFTDDLRTFVFTPPILGSATTNVQYTVALDDRLESATGNSILNDGGYIWSFTVGTVLDTEPPTVTRVTPLAGGTYDRNITVQLTFSEALDPTSASGRYNPANGENFESITVAGTSSGAVSGEYLISNEYKTITFQPSAACGINSCGNTLYCLSSADSMTVTAFAATNDLFPYNGIVDVNGNALDGDADGQAGGNYSWGFTTTGDVRLSGPEITLITPDIESSNINLDQDVMITFDSELMSSTVSTENFVLTSKPEHEMWFRTSQESTADSTTVTVKHGVFLESTADQTYLYGMSVGEGVQDIYQNCFRPAKGPGKNGGSCGTSASAPFCCNGVPQSTECQLF